MTESLDARLLWLAEQVRPNVFFIDIGSDHARLPIYLVQSGRITQAVASDIATGAVAQGRTHVAEQGLEAQITMRLGNGLQGMDLPAVADIAICGMGAGSICTIIGEQPRVKQGQTRLLLQAMTDTPVLRQYLATEGFDIEAEDCVYTEGRYYQCMVAVYTGAVRELDVVAAELGELNIQQRSPAFLQSVREREQRLQKWLPIKTKAGQDTTVDAALLAIYAQVLAAP